ncbi:ABC transporter ATP-binding protein [Nocardiopsis deserti]|uniref:ABC transporter ATP-binding protein n=1 Tax=Nocardiopsis deserti TaxID=2605988 RepID=UPI00123C6645|nr:ABC transporter ATP-binding protein [Nocardiopsis deserti]
MPGSPPTEAPAARGRHWVLRLLSACRRHPALAAGVAAAAVLGTGLAALAPLAAQIAVDDAVQGRTDRIGVLALTLLGAAALQFAGAFARQFLSGKLALGVQHDLRTAVFDSVQRLDGGKQDTLRTGQVMSRANIDLQLVQGLLATAPQALGGLVLIVFAFSAMLWLSPVLTVVAAAVVVSFVVVTARVSGRMPPATMAVQRRAAEIAQHVEETVTGVRVVKAFGQEERETRRLADLAARLFGERMRVARMQAAPSATLGVLPYLGQAAVLVVGAWLVARGEVSLGALVAFSGYMVTLTAPSASLSNLVMSAQLVRPAALRVFDLADSRPDVTDAPDAADVPEGPVGVELDGVRFGYTRDSTVLDGLSLRVRPGETLALVGPSGSGKSTVSLLLPRFYDTTGGAVRIGPPGGAVDVRSLRLRSLRSTVGVAFEEPFLFSGSVADNIAYGRPHATREQVRAAARAAGADGFVRALPDGYDTPVGERGLTLSGGQRQRVALARTLLGDPRVLVLDDATSAVDAATEAAMVTTLADVTADRTVLLVAHHRSTLALADRVAVLDGGRVVDVGTEAELARRCPLFVELCAGDGGDVEEPAAVSDAGGSSLWPEPVPEATDPDEAALPAADDRPAERLDRAPPEESGARFGVRRVLAPVRALLALAVLLVLADALATTALPVVLRWGLDHGVAPGDAGVVAAVGAAALALVAVNWWVLALQPRVVTRTGESALYALRLRVFRHLHRLGVDFHERERGGGTMTRMTTDVTALSTFVESGLTIVVVNGATVLGMVVAMLVLDPGLALVALAVLPVLLAATLYFRRCVSLAYHLSRERIGEVNADLQEQVAGARESQAAGAEDGASERFAALSDRYRRTRLTAQRHIALYFPFVTLLGDVSTAAVLGAGAYRVAEGTLSVGVLTAFLLYLGMFYAPFQQLSVVFDSYQQARVGVDRIGGLLNTPPAAAASRRAVPEPVRRGGGRVRLEGVGFTYPGAGGPALADVTLSADPGETVALVGETGAGKSTVVRLIARFHDPDRGAVLVDGTDVRDLDPAEHRRRLGVVPQEPHLFTGTVADNVRYGRPGASDREVEEAVRAVGALDAVAALPRGMRHPVGERGRGLSTGQRQLVALARAQLVAPDVLLLDEPSAGLDPGTERAVLTAMDRLSRGRTTFVVTHSLVTAARADRIAVLDGGRVVETGTHGELSASGGAYARLWRISGAGPVPV